MYDSVVLLIDIINETQIIPGSLPPTRPGTLEAIKKADFGTVYLLRVFIVVLAWC